MAASVESEGPPPGLQPTLSGSKTVFLKSIGTFCRTRQPRPNLSAAFPCLATDSPGDSRKQRDAGNLTAFPFCSHDARRQILSEARPQCSVFLAIETHPIRRGPATSLRRER